MIDLRAQLAELAEDTHASSDPTAGRALWEQGRRYARRRWRGTAAVALSTVLVLLGLGLAIELQQPEPVPASPAPTAQLGLPDRVWDPSPWLPGTEDHGPPGPLAMLRFTERGGWTGMREGVVGISARTGEYRFLDLPGGARVGQGSDGGPTLSPDGRRVAYWTSDGSTTDEHVEDDSGLAATGVAIYDTTTGEVTRAAFVSAHGFRDGPLVWMDNETLLIERSRYVRDHFGNLGPMSRGMPLLRWQPPGRPVPVRDWGGGWGLGSNGHGTLATDEGTSTEILTGPRAGTRFRVRPEANWLPVLSPSARQAAYIPARRSPNFLFVADVAGTPDDGRRQTGSRVGTRRWFNGVVGWLDERRVVVERFRLGKGLHDLVVVDVRTAEEEVLVRGGFVTCCGSPVSTIATDLLGAPTFAAQEPPRPWDRRVVGGLGVAVLVGGAAGVVAWRRRVAP